MSGSGGFTVVGAGMAGLSAALLLARAGQEVRVLERGPGFESFVMQRVGRAAFEAFYRPYVEKVWGLPAREISQTVAKSRLSTASPLAAISKFAQPRVKQFVYPSAGIGSMIRYLAEQLSSLGVTIETNARYHAAEHARRTVLFSGRLADLVEADLEHRGLYLLYMAFNRSKLADHETYYTPESKFWFGRVSELKNYSPRLGRENETVLVVEIPEGRWGPSERFDSGSNWQTLRSQLREAGIIDDGLTPFATNSSARACLSR